MEFGLAGIAAKHFGNDGFELLVNVHWYWSTGFYGRKGS
jgi:hypothetical protein